MKQDEILLYVVIAGFLIFILIIIYYYVTRWAHSVEKRIKYTEAQIKLLGKIAEKQGVSKEEIEGIYNEAVN
jgi:chromosome segregation and condensation protein ScpB